MEKNGATWLDGTFSIGSVQNHYPSGGVAQSFSATMFINGDPFTDAKYNTKIKQITVVFREEGGLRSPDIVKDSSGVSSLFLPQPISAFPVWQFVLTQVPARAHYVSYVVDGTTPEGNAVRGHFYMVPGMALRISQLDCQKSPQRVKGTA